MYRQFGSSALFFLLITTAVSHVTRSAPAPRAGDAVSSASGQAAKPVGPAVEGDVRKCSIFQVLRRYEGLAERPAEDSTADAGKSPIPGTAASDTPASDTLICSIAPESAAAVPGIDKFHSQVLLATIPDPLQSSEDLEFDRDIAALQQAASTVGYDFVQMMSPWRVTDLDQPKGLKDAREDEAYRRYFGDEPGAMLFRRRSAEDDDTDALMLLILVPESPTYGLNLHAAREAMSALPALRTIGFRTGGERQDAKTVRWIGPNFSAAASGLYRLKRLEYPDTVFSVLSGSVTSSSALKMLEKINANGCQPASLSEPDTTALQLLLDQQTREGADAGRAVAVLQEDESAYGGEHFFHEKAEQDANCNGEGTSGNKDLSEKVRYFSFPRGISHVRGIYGKSLTTFNAAQAEAGKTSGRGSTTFDFEDELQQPLDTVPEFATQSPSSNESVLAAVAASIKHLHVRSLVILTSDPLDLLFLARYFRQECPDTQIVLFNAERLLTRLRGEFNLDGTLVLTRFPLFQNSFLQTPFHQQERHSLTFTNSREESIFLAALMQMGSHSSLPVQAPFADRQFDLAPWISVAAGGDFWPVAYTGESRRNELSGRIDTNKSLLVTDTSPESLPAMWVLALFGVLLCACVHLGFFLIAVPLHEWLKRSAHHGIKRLAGHRFLSFYLVGKPSSSIPVDITIGQCWWLLNITVQFILLLSFFLLPALVYEAKILHVSSIAGALEHFELKTTFLIAGTAVVILLLLYLVTALLFLLGHHACSCRSRRSRTECFALSGISFSWLLLVLVLFSVQLRDATTGFAFADRCLHLSSGACPVLPLLLIGLGFLLAAVVNLNALGLAANRNPGLPLVFNDLVNMEYWQKKLNAYTERWYGLPGADGYLLGVAIAVGCLLLHPYRLFSTFDLWSMSWLYTISFIMAIWTILWLWARFIRMWAMLRFGLDFLEGSPLRFAFSRLPAIFSVDPIWSYAGMRRVMVLPMRWLEYLKVTPQAGGKPEVFSKDQAHLKTILEQMGDSQWTSSVAYSDFSARQNEYALMLARTPEVHAVWMRGGPDCSPSAADHSEAGKACITSRGDLPLPHGAAFDKDSFVEIANDFIAMRVTAYIRYITLHMKNLMMFMSLGFLFALLAAISYPFNQPQLIAWMAMVLLVVLLFSIGTVLAQMDRDAVLSRLNNNSPGEFHYGAFLKHMLAVGGLPMLTILSTLFPAIGSFLFSWAGPILENLH